MKLYNGDCIEIMQQLPDKSVDCIITDPPYGTTACKWDFIIPFAQMWEQVNRIIKDNGAILLFGSEPFSSALRMSNINNYKYDWIWDKVTATGMCTAKTRPMKEHEIISVFCNGTNNYYPIMEQLEKPEKYRCCASSDSQPLAHNDGAYRIREAKYPKSIITISNAAHGDLVHPTQKPTSLLEYLILTYTKKDEVILDFTMGSGSTGVAAVNTQRDFIGIELDPSYYEIASKRIKDAAAQGLFDFE